MRQFEPEQILDKLIQVIKTNRGIFCEDSWQPLRDPLFNCLRSLGKDAEYTVWDSEVGGEYLWDIVWSYERPGATEYWLELIGEIELTDPDRVSLLDDFYKVLDGKARLKIFVCAPPSRATVDWICEEIDWAVEHQQFRLPGERFITVVLDYDGSSKTHVHRVRLFDGSRPIGKWVKEWEVIEFKS